MTDYEQVFLSSGQEKQKLAIALKRFAEVSEPDWQNRYQSYLRTRFRPAMTELIHSGDLERIRRLCSFASLTAPHTGTVYSGGFRLRSDRNPYLSAPVKKRLLRLS